MTISNILLLIYVLVSFLSGCNLILHFNYIFKEFQNRTYNLFSRWAFVFTFMQFLFVGYFFCLLLGTPIPITKLFWLLIPLCLSILMYISLTINFEIHDTLFSNHRLYIWGIVLTNSIGGLANCYYFLTGSFYLWPFICIAVASSLFILTLITLQLFYKRQSTRPLLKTMLKHIVILNILALFFVGNDIYQYYLNLKHPDIAFTRLFTPLYIIIASIIFIIKSYGFYLGKNKSPIPFQLNESLLNEKQITAREKEIIGLLLDGKSNSFIAQQLYISLPTVKSHNSRIFRKFDVQSRIELLALISR